jgi:hypothetical protein
MKVVISLLVLSTSVVASAAVARDGRAVLRDHLALCRQFVIRDPDSRNMVNHMRDCCAFSWNVHDCQMYDWGTIERW